jgi:hypothetical protein
MSVKVCNCVVVAIEIFWLESPRIYRHFLKPDIQLPTHLRSFEWIRWQIKAAGRQPPQKRTLQHTDASLAQKCTTGQHFSSQLAKVRLAHRIGIAIVIAQPFPNHICSVEVLSTTKPIDS